MAIFTYDATLNPGQTHDWWTGGSGWYKYYHKPQLDAYPVNPGSKLIYWNCKCKLESNGLYTYYVSVKNEGPYPVSYKMRVWVP
ncbi:MAG: hypothetical protein OEZ44_06875 [Candidatus Bathyarchaeota archaeon]|nr:hypothetical protein [Candidatus Bathyarchaeota archaeon]